MASSECLSFKSHGFNEVNLWTKHMSNYTETRIQHDSIMLINLPFHRSYTRLSLSLTLLLKHNYL